MITSNAGGSGGALLAAGIAQVIGCVFSSNRAPRGPAISNPLSSTVTVTLDSVDFENNTRTCDDTTVFLEWTNVGG